MAFTKLRSPLVNLLRLTLQMLVCKTKPEHNRHHFLQDLFQSPASFSPTTPSSFHTWPFNQLLSLFIKDFNVMDMNLGKLLEDGKGQGSPGLLQSSRTAESDTIRPLYTNGNSQGLKSLKSAHTC